MAITTRMLCMYNSIPMYIYNDLMKHTIDQLLIQSIYLSIYLWVSTYVWIYNTYLPKYIILHNNIIIIDFVIFYFK